LNKPLNKCLFCKCKAEEFRTVDPLGYQIICPNKNCGAKTKIWNEYEDAVEEWNAGLLNANDFAVGSKENPLLCVTPKYIWLEHRARELADYICRLLDVPEPDIQAALESSLELGHVLDDRLKSERQI